MADLYPNKTEPETAKIVADYFTQITKDFIPLQDADIPAMGDYNDPIKLEVNEVCDRIRACKKPKGLLSGDVFPDIIQIRPPICTSLNERLKYVL